MVAPEQSTVTVAPARVASRCERASPIPRCRRSSLALVVKPSVKIREAQQRSDMATVTLRGTVERSYQRDAAERPIEHLEGVYAVTNLITIQASIEAQSG